MKVIFRNDSISKALRKTYVVLNISGEKPQLYYLNLLCAFQCMIILLINSYTGFCDNYIILKHMN